MNLTRLLCIALLLAPTAALAQTTPPTAPTYRDKSGQVQQAAGVANFCSADSGATWIPCPSSGGGGGGGGDASAANQTTQITAAQLTNTTLGAVTASPTANTIGDRLKTLNTTLGTPFQAGGSIGNTTFASTQSGTWNVTNISGTVSLPTGAATSAAQTTAQTSLSSIVTNTTGLATASAQTTAAGYLSTIATNSAAATPAGEAHVGELGGNQLTIQVAQTVTAAAYTSGNAVGGLMTLSSAARVSAGSGLLQSVVISTKSAQTTQVDVFIFSANPTGTTCTDKTAFALASADFDKVLGVASVTTWFSGGTPSIGQSQNLAMPYALASGTTLYACAVTRSTPTYASTSDVSVGFRVLRN